MRRVKLFFSGSVLFLTLLSLTSCSSANRDLEFEAKLPPAEHDVKPDSEAEYRFTQMTRQNPKQPLVIAMYLYEADEGLFHWKLSDQGAISQWKNSLANPSLVESMFSISLLTATGNSIAGLRYAAAAHGANTLLVLKTGGQVNSSINPLALFYLTGIGYYIFPGSHYTAEMAANGLVVDVATGEVIARLDAKKSASSWGPGGLLEAESAVDEVKAKVLGSMQFQFAEQLNKRHPEKAPSVSAGLRKDSTEAQASVTGAARPEMAQSNSVSNLGPEAANINRLESSGVSNRRDLNKLPKVVSY